MDLRSSFGRMAPLLLHCLCGDDDAMLDLQRLQTTLHRACRVQPIFLRLNATSCDTPFLWPTKLCMVTKAPLKLPFGGCKFPCLTRFSVVKTASRATFLERRQKQLTKKIQDAGIKTSSKFLDHTDNNQPKLLEPYTIMRRWNMQSVLTYNDLPPGTR